MSISRCFQLKFLLILLLLVSQSISAKMYRWVDKDGNVFYSDKIPKKYNKLRREELNKEAQIIEIIDKAKTKEQYETEVRLKKLRLQQQKIIEQHKKRDKVLLSSFRTVEALDMSIKRGVKSYEAKINVEKGNLNRLNGQLTALQKQAAKLERTGKETPKKTLDEINSTEQQIHQGSLEIERYLVKLNEYQEKSTIKVKRFQFLTQSDAETVERKEKTVAIEVAEKLGLFTCKDSQQCSLAWENVPSFVQGHSTTRTIINSSNLVMSELSKVDSDISLSISKIKASNDDIQLFLDIRCRQTQRGLQLCKSPKITSIRTSFVPYLNSKLEQHHRVTLSPSESE